MKKKRTVRRKRSNPQKTYRTESSFRKALKIAQENGTLVHWYGTDHGWVIVTKKLVKSNPRTIPAQLVPTRGGGYKVFVSAKHVRKMNPGVPRATAMAKAALNASGSDKAKVKRVAKTLSAIARIVKGKNDGAYAAAVNGKAHLTGHWQKLTGMTDADMWDEAKDALRAVIEYNQ